MVAFWITVLILSAALMGWSLATEHRRTTPTKHISLLSWHSPRGGPLGIRLLGALGSGGAVLGVLAATDDPAHGAALLAAGLIVGVGVQTVVLRRHNHRVHRQD